MKYIAGVAVVLIILGAALYYFSHRTVTSPLSNSSTEAYASSTLTASAVYSCDNGHSIRADFFEGAPSPEPAAGQPPTPTGSIKVSFDGGPTTTLAQTISADGGRYSDGNPQLSQGEPGAESFVFWDKGNTALIMRNNLMDLNYKNCIHK